ncbi:c-type cytochrome [Corallococcus sp. bb12-1]|uniref:c-type cytochrome n=1 Tax=Corallococcus sp. bb12-1 TaxID=2996784 RepID=UPI00226E441A|nr:c-type cytochrome [Corallococcus sp. bb12-1]MCY1044371.1 c-type cytochrome [Corallococcus sp. bb12-1]
MKRLTLLILLLAPGLASAQAGGQTAFRKACARCHIARVDAPGTKARPRSNLVGRYPGAGPNLGELLPKRNLSQVRTWIDAPYKVKAGTGCDTRLLAEADKDRLISFLVSRTQPPAKRRDVAQRQELEKGLAEQREQQARRKADPKNPPKQGSK